MSVYASSSAVIYMVGVARAIVSACGASTAALLAVGGGGDVTPSTAALHVFLGAGGFVSMYAASTELLGFAGMCGGVRIRLYKIRLAQQ